MCGSLSIDEALTSLSQVITREIRNRIPTGQTSQESARCKKGNWLQCSRNQGESDLGTAKTGLKGSEMLAVAVQLNQIQAPGDSLLAEYVAHDVTITPAEA